MSRNNVGPFCHQGWTGNGEGMMIRHGVRIAVETWQDVFPTITRGQAYPWEDIRLKEEGQAGLDGGVDRSEEAQS